MHITMDFENVACIILVSLSRALFGTLRTIWCQIANSGFRKAKDNDNF